MFGFAFSQNAPVKQTKPIKQADKPVKQTKPVKKAEENKPAEIKPEPKKQFDNLKRIKLHSKHETEAEAITASKAIPGSYVKPFDGAKGTKYRVLSK